MNKKKAFAICFLAAVLEIQSEASLNESSEDIVFRLKKDYLLEQFLKEEFSYDRADKYVHSFSNLPFRDIHADSYFRTGLIKLSKLKENINTNNFTGLLGTLELKPWVPLEGIRDELEKCAEDFNYVSYTTQQFSYDKSVYGIMSIWKFACRLAFDQTVVYGIGMERFRFRLKEVLLNTLVRFWASAGRAITLRDMQKLMSHFNARFAESMRRQYEREIKKLTENVGPSSTIFHDPSRRNRVRKPDVLVQPISFVTTKKGCVQTDPRSDNFESCFNLQSLTEESKTKLNVFFPFGDIQELAYHVKDFTFKSATIPIDIRIMLAKPEKINQIVESLKEELSNESLEVLATCTENVCDEPNAVMEIPKSELKSELTDENAEDEHHFFQDRALRYNIAPNNVLLAYSTSSPKFSMESMTRGRTFRKKIHATPFPQETKEKWYKLLQSQVATNFAVHHLPAVVEQ